MIDWSFEWWELGVFIISIGVHEFGHWIVAKWLNGDPKFVFSIMMPHVDIRNGDMQIWKMFPIYVSGIWFGLAFIDLFPVCDLVIFAYVVCCMGDISGSMSLYDLVKEKKIRLKSKTKDMYFVIDGNKYPCFNNQKTDLSASNSKLKNKK